ncbi:MAG: GNAT family N-acetyltransferase [Caldilineaceae bacterium]
MATLFVEVESFDLHSASQAEWLALNALANRIRAEIHPDDPPIPDAEMIQGWQNIPSFMAALRWVVWAVDRTAIIGSSSAVFTRTASNQHLLEFNIEVLPAFRRQGLGVRLLAPIGEIAQRENRALLMARTTARIPAGEAFLQRLGASKGLESHVNQLQLAELDPALLAAWQKQAAERAGGFDLIAWADPCPNEHLEAVARLVSAGLSQQPHGELKVTEITLTPEQIRQEEQSFAAAGQEHWTICACERASGQWVGLTDVFWQPNRPQILLQGLTIVLPAYRGRGLGRWLKAAMLDKVLSERPQVKFVRTRNADSNAAMLKINQELGFKPYLSTCVWQVETEQVIHYLKQKRGNYDV